MAWNQFWLRTLEASTLHSLVNRQTPAESHLPSDGRSSPSSRATFSSWDSTRTITYKPGEQRVADSYLESNLNKFMAYFKEEIKDQIKGNPRNKL
ncbi:hypothetical protein PENDEC_c002G03256 [Penicillium decumbens]|uniref:Uncharacterized protein n=1 Tax=Penicillium decumbens TaxID=69771 RepID=A0A1V6PLF9_PENDC|nr:hypothetical protein PENDEC_c002G03256 [Penicillium decumbens]